MTVIWPKKMVNVASHKPVNVTLIDGRVVDDYSEEWRAECEARSVCKMRTKRERAAYCDRVQARRGFDAASKLIADVRAVWNAEFRRDY